MPNEMKRWMHGELTALFREHPHFVLVDFTGVDSDQTLLLRRKIRSRQLIMQIVPNRIARRALADLGLTGAEGLLKGQTAVVVGTGEAGDPVALSKAVLQLAKENDKLAIKGGYAEGKALDKDGLAKLSKTPGRPELYAKIAGLLQAPVTGAIRCVRGPAEKFARLVRNAGDKQNEAAAEPAAAS